MLRQLTARVLLFLLVKTVNRKTARLYARIPGAESAFLWARRVDEENWLDRKRLIPKLFPGMRVWFHLTDGVYAHFESSRAGTVLEVRNGGALVLHDDGRKFGWAASELLPLRIISFKTRFKFWLLR